MPNSHQADKTFLMGKKNDMLPQLSLSTSVPGNTNVMLN